MVEVHIGSLDIKLEKEKSVRNLINDLLKDKEAIKKAIDRNLKNHLVYNAATRGMPNYAPTKILLLTLEDWDKDNSEISRKFFIEETGGYDETGISERAVWSKRSTDTHRLPLWVENHFTPADVKAAIDALFYPQK